MSVFAQVASQETYGTLGAIVRSQTGSRQVGFLTNRHVAVDLDYPNQKMFHPLPPTLGPGVYLGAVERATSFITDELWYGIFAGINPGKMTSSCEVCAMSEAFAGKLCAFLYLGMQQICKSCLYFRFEDDVQSQEQLVGELC